MLRPLAEKGFLPDVSHTASA